MVDCRTRFRSRADRRAAWRQARAALSTAAAALFGVGATPAAEVKPAAPDCVVSALAAGASVRVNGRVLEVPSDGMVLPDCPRAAFETPSIRVRYLLYPNASSYLYYDSEETDRGKVFTERIQPRVSYRELLRRQLRPAGKYAGFVSVERIGDEIEVFVAETATGAASAGTRLRLGTPESAAVDVGNRRRYQLCLDESWRELDCQRAADKTRVRLTAMATKANLATSDSVTEYVVQPERSAPVRYASVPGFELVSFLHSLRAVVKPKDEPVQVRKTPSERLDQLLAELTLATLTGDGEMVETTKLKLAKEFPQLFQQIAAEPDQLTLRY
jgi:hypothetical protein